MVPEGHVDDLLQQANLRTSRARPLAENRDQVGAVNQPEEARHGLSRKCEFQDRTASFPVDQFHRLRRHALRPEFRPEAQRIQDPRTIRSDLQARAHFAQLGRLFQYGDLRALERQRPRQGKPRDARAQYRHRPILQHASPR